MKTKSDARALVRKQAGKDAVIILNKVDKMLKRGVARKEIESILTEELLACFKKQIKFAICHIDDIAVD